jgi:hypothetical protein
MMDATYSGESLISKEPIKSIRLPDEDEQRVMMPLSIYKELMRIYRLYMNQTERTCPFNPNPIVPDYTRPQPNDWPQRYTPWC